MSKEKIKFPEFLEIEKKLEIKIGKIIGNEEVPKSLKLIKLTVDFGEEKPRIVVTNIKPLLETPGWLFGKSFLFITNLEPTKMMSIESTAMIMPGQIEEGKWITANGEPGTKLL